MREGVHTLEKPGDGTVAASFPGLRTRSHSSHGKDSWGGRTAHRLPYSGSRIMTEVTENIGTSQ